QVELAYRPPCSAPLRRRENIFWLPQWTNNMHAASSAAATRRQSVRDLLGSLVAARYGTRASRASLVGDESFRVVSSPKPGRGPFPFSFCPRFFRTP